MQGRFRRYRLLDESGQDLIEYGLLVSIVAVAGILLVPAIQAAMVGRFDAWGVEVNKLWVPDNP
jgi:Flp pilus assembly pilin Flp